MTTDTAAATLATTVDLTASRMLGCAVRLRSIRQLRADPRGPTRVRVRKWHKEQRRHARAVPDRGTHEMRHVRYRPWRRRWRTASRGRSTHSCGCLPCDLRSSCPEFFETSASKPRCTRDGVGQLSKILVERGRCTDMKKRPKLGRRKTIANGRDWSFQWKRSPRLSCPRICCILRARVSGRLAVCRR